MYIHQLKDWPNFTWDNEKILPVLGNVRHRQGIIALYKWNRPGLQICKQKLHCLTPLHWM